MKMTKALIGTALAVALFAGAAEAGKGGGGKPGGGGNTPTNYGCQTFSAGKRFYNSTGGTKTLLTSTYTCYICNLSTGVCAVQSPSSLVGWYFNLPF